MDSAQEQEFIEAATSKFGWDEQFTRAFDYAISTGHSDKRRPRSITVANRVLQLDMDREAVLATLLSDPGLRDLLPIEKIETEFGATVAGLTRGVNQLNTLKNGKQTRLDSPEQAEMLRRLLMAIISDARVMLIKLCYRGRATAAAEAR